MNEFFRRKNNIHKLICGVSIIVISIGALYLWNFFKETSVQRKLDKTIFHARGDASTTGQKSSDVDSVEYLLSLMTIEEKIGQMFVFGFDGLEPNKHIISAIKEKKIGGVILYDRNMQNPRQVAGLNNALKHLAALQRLGIPLLICVDQEGGIVTRMEDRVAAAPSQKKQGDQAESAVAYSISSVTAKELRAMGFSVNFAPVLDLSESDSRSYGTNPDKVASFGMAAVDAYRNNGIISAIKHFPGLGRSKVDTHFDFDVVKASAETLGKSDIVPFARVMQSTDHSNFMVMMTHLIFTAYDSQNPSSVSPAIIKGLLREKMGFSGLIVTDDMEMGGLSKIVSYDAMGLKAVEAGIDIMLVCQEKENQDRVYRGVLNAVKSGKISEARIDESVRRILRTKQLYQGTLTQVVNLDDADTIVGNRVFRETMKNYGKLTPR